MANGILQNLTKDLELYARFIAKLSALVAHRFIMKPSSNTVHPSDIEKQSDIVHHSITVQPSDIVLPSGDIIKHWTSVIYTIGDHVYHFVHSASNILIPIILSLLLIRVSCKILLLRPDRTPGYLLILIYRIPGISHIRNWLRKLNITFKKEESHFHKSQE